METVFERWRARSLGKSTKATPAASPAPRASSQSSLNAIRQNLRQQVAATPAHQPRHSANAPLTAPTSSVSSAGQMPDMRAQLDLKFDTLEEAVSYAKANKIPHQVVQSQKMKRIPRSYADNFAYDRKLPWTH